MLRSLLTPFARSSRYGLSHRSYTHLVFDLDNTLYPLQSGIMDALGARVAQFVADETGLSIPLSRLLDIYLFEKFGSVHPGLQSPPFNLKIPFLEYCEFCFEGWDVSSFLSENLELREMLCSLDEDVKLWIFSNGIASHVRNVLDVVGIKDCFAEEKFLTIELINAVDEEGYLTHFLESTEGEYEIVPLCCKPHPEAFRRASDLMGVSDEDVVFVDDALENLISARDAVGWTTVWLCPEMEDSSSAMCDFVIEQPQDLSAVLPGLFRTKK